MEERMMLLDGNGEEGSGARRGGESKRAMEEQRE